MMTGMPAMIAAVSAATPNGFALARSRFSRPSPIIQCVRINPAITYNERSAT